MKILFVIQGMQSGGAERVASILCNGMVEHNMEVVMALTERTDKVAYKLDEKIDIVDMTCHTGNVVKNRIQQIKKLRALYKSERPDVVISFITRTNLCAIIAGLGLKIPVVISERNNPKVDPKSKLTRFLRDMLYPLAAGCVFQTKYAMDCFGKMIKRKSVVIYNPVSDDVLKIPKINERENVIVLIGRLEEQKNIPLLIEAMRVLYKKYPEYNVNIYGEGSKRDALLEMISEYGLQDRVILKGYTSETIHVLSKSKLFVLCSDYEGMPNALMEAMCAGCACVSTDAPAYGARELIQDGINGKLVEVGNVQQLANALEQLMSDEELCRTMGERAKEIQSILDAEMILGQWIEFISERRRLHETK